MTSVLLQISWWIHRWKKLWKSANIWQSYWRKISLVFFDSQRIHRCMKEWFYCHFAAGSFHTKKLCSTLYSIELEFYSQKNDRFAFEPPFGGIRGDRRMHFIYFLFAIIEHFLLGYYGWQPDRYQSASFKGIGHFDRKFQVEGDVAHQRLLVSEN